MSNRRKDPQWRLPPIVASAILLAIFFASSGNYKTFAADALQTIAQVRALTVEQTRQKIPVQLHGVVTFFDENLFSHFIQDETAGIYLQFPTNNPLPMLVPGQRVEVTGIASAGEYAPVVLVSEVKVTGE